MAAGFTDPLKPAARRNMRYETFNGMAGEAAAFVEPADAGRGVLSDGSMLSIRRGEHTVMLMSTELAQRDRGAALKTLEALGRVAAPAARLTSTPDAVVQIVSVSAAITKHPLASAMPISGVRNQ